MTVDEIIEYGHRIASILQLSGQVVGVRFLQDPIERLGASITLIQHRYCQALMKARRGQSVLLDSAGIACPAAAALSQPKEDHTNPNKDKVVELVK